MTDTVLPEPADALEMLHDADTLDPLADAEEGVVKNRAKVGSARPSSLLYTYGPGAIMDLPGFSIMPAGLDDWEPIWKRRENIPTILEPRLLNVVRLHLGPQVDALRPFPWQPKKGQNVTEGNDLGIPARVFPQWFRCTGCDYLGPLSRFSYTNTHPFRPDLAQFTHKSCPGRGRARPGQAKKKGRRNAPAVPAQHLLTCTNGHLDEFPYTLWVHRGKKCPKAELPDLKMRDANVGKSVGSIDHLRVLRSDPRHGRGPRCSWSREAPAEVPRSPPAPQRLRRRMRRPPSADHDGRVEPVVRLHPVDHRHAPHRR